jgi:hypothetical protein
LKSESVEAAVHMLMKIFNVFVRLVSITAVSNPNINSVPGDPQRHKERVFKERMCKWVLSCPNQNKCRLTPRHGLQST